jgi:hypothetical protein
MNNKVLLAGLVGAVFFFFAGWIIYGMLLMDFFASSSGSATGVMKDPPELWAIAVGNLAWGLLLAVVLSKWTNASNASGGAGAGLIMGLLAALAFDMMYFGTTNIMNLQAALADVVVFGIMSMLGGAIVGMMLGRGSQ